MNPIRIAIFCALLSSVVSLIAGNWTAALWAVTAAIYAELYRRERSAA